MYFCNKNDNFIIVAVKTVIQNFFAVIMSHNIETIDKKRGQCDKMAKKKTIDFQALLDEVDTLFPTYQAMDKDGT